MPAIKILLQTSWGGGRDIDRAIARTLRSVLRMSPSPITALIPVQPPSSSRSQTAPALTSTAASF